MIMVTLTIKGFETEEQAQAFWEWYEGQGEQNLSDWMDCQDNDIKYMNTVAPFRLVKDANGSLIGTLKVTPK